MRICRCTLLWGPYNVLLHFSNLDIPSIEKLDDALLAPWGISQKRQICIAITKIYTFDKGGGCLASDQFEFFSDF